MWNKVLWNIVDASGIQTSSGTALELEKYDGLFRRCGLVVRLGIAMQDYSY